MRARDRRRARRRRRSRAPRADLGGAHLDPVAAQLLDAARPQRGGGEAVVAEHAVHGAGGVVAAACRSRARARAGGRARGSARRSGPRGRRRRRCNRSPCRPGWRARVRYGKLSCRNGKDRRTRPRPPEGAARRARAQPGGGRRARGHGGLDAQPARVRRAPARARPPDAARRRARRRGRRPARPRDRATRACASSPRIVEGIVIRPLSRHAPGRARRRAHGLPRRAHDPRPAHPRGPRVALRASPAACGSCSATTT